MLEEQRKWCVCGLVIDPSLGDVQQAMPWCWQTRCSSGDTSGRGADKPFALE